MVFDPKVVHAKYLAERDKRLVPGRTAIRDLTHDDYVAGYRADPFTPYIEREPVSDDVDVVIVGGGIAGILAGAHLRRVGIERIRIVDQAGGMGGTWYWNRYPGVMCDVESYQYLPMLEELDYIPLRNGVLDPVVEVVFGRRLAVPPAHNLAVFAFRLAEVLRCRGSRVARFDLGANKQTEVEAAVVPRHEPKVGPQVVIGVGSHAPVQLLELGLHRALACCSDSFLHARLFSHGRMGSPAINLLRLGMRARRLPLPGAIGPARRDRCLRRGSWHRNSGRRCRR